MTIIADADGVIAEYEAGDTWEELCERGRIAQGDMDAARWQIGDDAGLVRKVYGHDKIAEYAKEINLPPSRVTEYRTVAAFYEKSARADFLESHPTITYSHMRVAKRLKDIDKALDFLEAATGECWTVDQTIAELNKRLGKPVPAAPLVKDVFVRVNGPSGNFGVILDIPDNDTRQRILQAWRAGDAKALFMTLKIYEE